MSLQLSNRLATSLSNIRHSAHSDLSEPSTFPFPTETAIAIGARYYCAFDDAVPLLLWKTDKNVGVLCLWLSCDHYSARHSFYLKKSFLSFVSLAGCLRSDAIGCFMREIWENLVFLCLLRQWHPLQSTPLVSIRKVSYFVYFSIARQSDTI